MRQRALEVRIDAIVADDPTLDGASLQHAIRTALARVQASQSVSASQSTVVRLSAGEGAQAIAGAVARTVASAVGSRESLSGEQREPGK